MRAPADILSIYIYIDSVGIGDVEIEIFADGVTRPSKLTGVLLKLRVEQNLVYIGKLTDRGFTAGFSNHDLKVRSGLKLVATESERL